MTKKKLKELYSKDFSEYIEAQKQVRDSFYDSECLIAEITVKELDPVSGGVYFFEIPVEVLSIDIRKKEIKYKDPFAWYSPGKTKDFKLINPSYFEAF